MLRTGVREDLYTGTARASTEDTVMIPRLTKYVLFAAYQLSVAMGIALLPVALAARRMGVTLPIRRLVETTGTAYKRAAGR